MSNQEITQKPVINKSEFIRALQQQFATTVKRMFVNGLNTEVAFREVKVSEQKSMSRILIDNENRKDIVYDAQCALINQTALTEGFDIYNCTEFDKIKLMMMLYQSNMYKSDVKFTCPECKTENSYHIDFNRVISRLDEYDLSDKPFEFENENWKFKFVLNYPTVKRVSEFYRSFAPRYRKLQTKKDIDSLNSIVNMDYINTYIKSITLLNKATGAETEIDLSQFTTNEISEIFSSFPQDVLYVEDGVLSFIAKEFIQKIDEAFDKHVCAQCGTVHEEAIDKDTGSFF